jgi:hypothetical protein
MTNDTSTNLFQILLIQPHHFYTNPLLCLFLCHSGKRKNGPQCHFVRHKFQTHSPRCVGHMQRDVDIKQPETNGSVSPSGPDCRSVCIFTIRTQTHPLDRPPDTALPRTECGKNHGLMSHKRTHWHPDSPYCGV